MFKFKPLIQHPATELIFELCIHEIHDVLHKKISVLYVTRYTEILLEAGQVNGFNKLAS